MKVMKPEELKKRDFESEFVFSASRSSGPGGQNINKVNTRIELRFSISRTMLLSDTEKELILSRLINKINNEGELILSAQSERTQLMNRKAVTGKFFRIVAKALTTMPYRISTKPTQASVNKRLVGKKNRGMKKKFRKIPGENHEDLR
jgi:ribosome-associated protein